MISSKQIRKDLQDIWPNLDGKSGFILLTDKNFLEPDFDELLEVLKEHKKFFNETKQEFSVEDLFGGSPPKRDCDKWAKSADAYVDKYYREKDSETLARIFGKCIGTKFNGVRQNHTKCWTRSKGSIWLVEPQVPEITSPTKGDEIWFATTL